MSKIEEVMIMAEEMERDELPTKRILYLGILLSRYAPFNFPVYGPPEDTKQKALEYLSSWADDNYHRYLVTITLPITHGGSHAEGQKEVEESREESYQRACQTEVQKEGPAEG